MEQILEPDVFTATVAPLIRAAKEHGASARTLSEAFVNAMTGLYSDVDLKETSAMIGLIQLLQAEGGSVSARNAAKLYGGSNNYSAEAVRKAAQNGQLIAIRDGNGNLFFPVWQFAPRGGALPNFKEVLAILARRPHSDDIARATFFLNPTSRLGGISPLEALRQGDTQLIIAVKQLALGAAE